APKSASVLQSIVGMSLSTFGVVAERRVQTPPGSLASWKVRRVTPGSWGGRTSAAAGAAMPAPMTAAVASAATTRRPVEALGAGPRAGRTEGMSIITPSVVHETWRHVVPDDAARQV